MTQVVEEVGVVVAIPAPGRAVVSLARSERCAHCPAACHGDGRGEMAVDVHDPLGAVPGQRVRFILPASTLLGASRAFWLLPLGVFLLLGGLVSVGLTAVLKAETAQGGGLLAGLVGMAATWFLLHRSRRKARKDAGPRIVEFLESSPEVARCG